MAYLRPDLERLASDATVIYYDQRGGGRSSLTINPKDLSVNKHVRDLEAVRKFFGLERITVLGHSWGAGLAIEYALRYPQRVERVVLVSAMAPRRTPYYEQADTNIMRWMDERARSEFSALSAAMANPTTSTETCRRFFALLGRGYYAEPSRMKLSRGDSCGDPPGAIQAGDRTSTVVFESLGDWDYRERVKQLGVRTLLIHGASDPIPLASAKEWAASLPVSRLLVVPDSGHFPFVEQPERFFPAVREFMTGAWPAGSVSVSDAQ
jgi:proline iminopeptidase